LLSEAFREQHTKQYVIWAYKFHLYNSSLVLFSYSNRTMHFSTNSMDLGCCFSEIPNVSTENSLFCILPLLAFNTNTDLIDENVLFVFLFLSYKTCFILQTDMDVLGPCEYHECELNKQLVLYCYTYSLHCVYYQTHFVLACFAHNLNPLPN